MGSWESQMAAGRLPPMPSPGEFFIKTPLYEAYSLDLVTQEELSQFGHFFYYTVDAYCPKCGSHSIFTGHIDNAKNEVLLGANDHVFVVKLACQRDRSHILKFIFEIDRHNIRKIGQSPSLADLHIHDAAKFKPVLKGDLLHEFTKAIGLAAHGVGIGSFVYLRRIFESLINEARSIAETHPGWDEATFQKGRMVERIGILADQLPTFLVENKSLYGILSKGIHELSEADCLAAFPVVKVGIEMILDEKLSTREKQKKLDDAKKAIQSVASTLTSSNGNSTSP